MDSSAKVEYNIRNLPTRSVTLFPSRAQVVRSINDVPLQPGTNEVTIYGLSPTVDEDSIRIEGSGGSAIISDIAVESLPNRDIFEDVYPESDNESSSEESDEEEEIDPPKHPDLVLAEKRLQGLEAQLKEAKELIASAESRRKALDDYTKTLSCEHGVVIEDSMDSYRQARESLFKDHMDGERRKRELEPEIQDAKTKLSVRLKLWQKEKKRANRDRQKAIIAKRKALEKQGRRDQEARAEKNRIRKEREKFWPKYCYAVRILLEANSFTPNTSRRNSMSSDIDIINEKAESPATLESGEQSARCDLVLTYVTSAAFWTPSYDLQLSTIGNNGTLCFDAQLKNTTSETWEKCKVTLSTSQTTSSSLDDKAPELDPWRLALGPGPADDDLLLYSREESDRKDQLKWRQQMATSGKSRAEMFGIDESHTYNTKLGMVRKKKIGWGAENVMDREGIRARTRNAMPAPPPGQAQQQIAQSNTQSSSFAYRGGGLFGAARAAPAQEPGAFGAPAAPATLMAAAPQPQTTGYDAETTRNRNLDQPRPEDYDSDEAEEEQKQLDFEDSLVEESGYTTSYDLPGLKTLAPKSNSSKQRIARINLANIVFSHTVVAKYKPAAHLTAKLANNSKVTLLKGPVGVTLDGSFMGRTTLPRCGANGESIRLSLGVDPAIKVAYSTPEVKRATTGFFTKEDIKLYTRSIRLENTRTSTTTHTKLMVKDQIPISRDDKLRIELLKPEGLVPEGDGKEAGEGGRDKDKDSWGTATAKLAKDGEVNWQVGLRPGKSVKLNMEYLIATPIGSHAAEV